MTTLNKPLKAMRGVLVPLVVAAATVGLATPASAYALYKTTTCKPGLKWDTSRPVTVRLLAESVTDYLVKQGRGLSGMTGFVRDVEAVIQLYNSVRGGRLVLELGTGITGDRRLDHPSIDDFGEQTIVIGFTDKKLDNSSAEAWANGDPEDGCTRTRAHITFRDDYDWIYGPPDTTEVNGRAFYTAAQQKLPGSSARPRTFLGILTHEMGHAIGLTHPDNDYAVMAQGFKTWFRGANHVLRTRLLPDDTAGILALYGTAGARKPLDISVSNTWYKSAQAQAADQCLAEIAAVNAAERALKEALDTTDGSVPGQMFFKSGQHADLIDAFLDAEDALRVCEEEQNAMQIAYCKVSSRGDEWADRLATPLPFCGVNSRTGSAYPPVSDRVCPGAQVQLRYTLNNHTSLRDALVKSEVWFSPDAELNVSAGRDTRSPLDTAVNVRDAKSPDVREFTVSAADSATIGQTFRVPANLRSGNTFYVFVRAIPHDPATGASLWNSDSAPWNNAIMLASKITVDTSACR